MPSLRLDSRQKSLVAQFIAFTQASEKQATKQLKEANWNVDNAVDNYYGNEPASPVPAAVDKTANSLNALFDKYRSDPTNEPDKMGLGGLQNYLKDLKIDLESPKVLIICELTKAPSIDGIEREGFVQGWKSHNATSISAQKTTTSTLEKSLPTHPDLFKRIYSHTFIIIRPANSRNVPLDTACEMLTLLFSQILGYYWNNPRTHWLDLYTTYLKTMTTRDVTKDLWSMTLQLRNATYNKSVGDLEWDAEANPWHSTIDGFVEWAKAQAAANGGNERDAMFVD